MQSSDHTCSKCKCLSCYKETWPDGGNGFYLQTHNCSVTSLGTFCDVPDDVKVLHSIRMPFEIDVRSGSRPIPQKCPDRTPHCPGSPATQPPRVKSIRRGGWRENRKTDRQRFLDFIVEYMRIKETNTVLVRL